MDRFTHNGYAMVKNDDGRYVLHADHAAELAEWKQRAERAEAYVAGQDVRSDFQTAGVMRMALDAVTKTLATASRENTLLRAECEAWRAVDVLQAEENDTGEEVVGMAEERYTLHRAMAATDAAGILKGAE